jgi:plasmid stabilization system protein ParE
VSETALPVAVEPEASNAVEDASVSTPAAVAADAPPASDKASSGDEAPKAETTEEPPKVEKTPEQREVDRLRRKIDRLVRQREELRAQQHLTPRPIEEHNQESADDSEPLTLSRSELNRLVEQRAREVAPTIKRQQDAIEHRQSVVEGLARSWGQERFDALASDLEDAFGGLKDHTGQIKPATDAIFEADDPKHLIEYLADPDNAAEATRIARLSPVQTGLAIAKLELKLAQTKAQAKPEASKVPAPIEPPRGQGRVTKNPSEMTDREFADWRRAQIKARN